MTVYVFVLRSLNRIEITKRMRSKALRDDPDSDKNTESVKVDVVPVTPPGGGRVKSVLDTANPAWGGRVNSALDTDNPAVVGRVRSILETVTPVLDAVTTAGEG